MTEMTDIDVEKIPEKPGKIMLHAAKGLAYCLLTLFITSRLVQQTSLWYWTPLTDDRPLDYFVLDSSRTKYDVIVLGSSISRLGIIPAVMEEELSSVMPQRERVNVYNTSVDGGLLPSYLDIMRGIVGRNQKPKLVIMYLGIREFTGSNTDHLAREIRCYSRSFKDIAAVVRHIHNAEGVEASMASFTHGMESILQLPFFLDEEYWNKIESFRVRRGGGYYYPFTEAAIKNNRKVYAIPGRNLNIARTKMSRVIKRQIPDFEISPIITYWMLHIFEQAKKKKVNLVVLLGPDSRWLETRIYPVEKRKAVAYLKKICEAENIPWHNLNGKRFRPGDLEFWDGCNHLGPPGAEKLTRAVTREIVAPYFY